MATRVFISLGMSGRPKEEVEKDIAIAETYIRESIVDPEIVHNYNCVDGCTRRDGSTWYLPKAIELLGTCDIAYFTPCWTRYNGCQVEMRVCTLYGIPTFGPYIKALK